MIKMEDLARVVSRELFLSSNGHSRMIMGKGISAKARECSSQELRTWGWSFLLQITNDIKQSRSSCGTKTCAWWIYTKVDWLDGRPKYHSERKNKCINCFCDHIPTQQNAPELLEHGIIVHHGFETGSHLCFSRKIICCNTWTSGVEQS